MSFITDGGSYEWKIENGANTYGAENLCGGTLQSGVFDRISIGNVRARELLLKMWNPTIDPTQPIALKLVKTDADGNTETIGKGTYFVDTIEESPYSEYTSITAFDALLKTEVPYMKSGEYSPISDYAMALQIASDIGVSLESGTETLLAANPITINEVPSIGDNGTTERELLSVIGVLRGGNWIINDANELQLVLLSGLLPVSPSVVYVDSDGDLAAKPVEALESADSVVSINGSGNFEVIAFSAATGSTYLWYVGADGKFYADTWTNIQAIAPVDPSQTIVIGDEVVSFDVSPTEEITRVEVWANGSTSYRTPSGLTQEAWEALGGIVLSADMPMMASQEVADELYASYNGCEYVPFSADEAYFDPEAPLGTSLQIKNDTVVLTQRALNIDVLAASDMSAEATQAQKSYYPKLTPFERQTKEDIIETKASIQVADDSITAEVVRAKGAEEALGTQITQAADYWEVELQNFKDDTQEYMRYESGVLELGKSDSNFKAQLSNTELAFTGEDGTKAAWISNTQLNIKEAVIETDEKFKGSSGNWVQQVVNDHFQIKWVAN